MTNPAAARLAERIRAAMEAQSLSGSGLADRVGRLTGERPTEMTVSRWRSGYVSAAPLVRVSPHLVTIARALELDPVELACDAVRAELAATSTDPGEVEGSAGSRSDRAIRSAWKEWRQHKLPAATWVPFAASLGVVVSATNPNQSPDCTHPDFAGYSCPSCCDTCNNDGHACEGCGQPVGHLAVRCPDCADTDEED